MTKFISGEWINDCWGLGMGWGGREMGVVIKGQQRDPCDNGTVQCFGGGGYKDLHM